MFSISTTTIDSQQLSNKLEDERAGAFVCFEGRVRNHNDGRQVTALEYEAYEELALKEGERVIKEAKEKFGILNCIAVHRTGPLAIGDVAVWVGVVSAHRAEAFDGCRYIIDEIKHRLPVWKREHYADGKIEWVNCATCANTRSPEPAKAYTKGTSHKHESARSKCNSVEEKAR
ncbi:MAG: molybdenum cofactor biosynthesis protein MoaE [Candidatus Obscuribacterales bacterium]|nr:molybdenum cofactor biosynthesis protein MoaE [Candidatus Obscuribacterales bacterium]